MDVSSNQLKYIDIFASAAIDPKQVAQLDAF
jgi:hypothetical protein